MKPIQGNSLEAQWLGIHAFTTDDPGLIPSQGIKIPWRGQKKSHSKG